MADSLVESLATAVADGDAVDWRAVSGSLDSENDRALAAQLESLSALSHPLSAQDVDTTLPALLPAPLEWVARVTVAMTVLGAGGLCVMAQRPTTGIVIFLTGVFLFGATATWLWRAAGNAARVRALSAVYWTMAASFAAVGVLRLARMLPPSLVVKGLVALRPEAFMPAFFWAFVREFPRVRRFSPLDRLSYYAEIVSAFAATLLVVANLIPARLSHREESAVWWLSRSYHDGRWFWLVIFGLTIPALVVMALRAKRASSQEKSRVGLFLLSVTLAVAPVAIEVSVEGLSPRFAAYMRTPVGHWWGAWIVYGPLFVFPVLTVYVLLVHDVLEVRMRVQRGLHYILARSVLTFATAVPIALLGWVFYAHRQESVATIITLPAPRLLAWTAVVSVALLAGRQPILAMVDRWMDTGSEPPATVLAGLGEALREARTPLEVASSLGLFASRAMQSELEIYWVEDHGRMTRAQGHGPAALPDSLIPVLAQGIGRPFVIESHGSRSYRNLLTLSDRKWIADVGTTAVCPLVVGLRERPSVLVALNRRRTTTGFSQGDMHFLAAACGSAALAGQRLLQRESGATEEELALQCTGCGRVVPWNPDARRCDDCGADYVRASLPSAIGDRFRLDAILGKGGMGVVYRASDLQLQRPVAIKTLPRLSQHAAEDLRREARAMAALTHPQVAVVFGVETWRGTPLLIVEYLSGGTLADRLARGPLPTRDALDIVESLARTLVYMHARGRSHGDIKPSNIAFTDDGLAKFLDFGLSGRTMDQDGVNEVKRGGTLAFMSPEAMDWETSPTAEDIWALSVVLCHAVSGIHPFLDGKHTAGRIRQGWRGARGTASIHDPAMLAAMARLLDRSLENRPATADALVTSVTSLKAQL